MKRTIILLILLTNISFAQSNKNFLTDFLLESELKAENVLDNYNQFDYSNIWTLTQNNNILGIIGQDHQRLRIKLISVVKDPNNANQYFVSGMSRVKGTICNFEGTIKITQIKEVKEMHFGVDEEYSDKGIYSEGLLIADYEFKENPEQNHSGIFRGKLYSKWYLNSENEIKYDEIQSVADSYSNNAFIGVWKSYSTGNEKICNWADFRVPLANKDFDIGAGEFFPSEKYYDKGWSDYGQMKADEWWK